MTEWVTADTILRRAGAPAAPPADDLEYAEICAAAVNAGLDERLDGVEVLVPLPAELVLVAQLAGVEAYKRREAVFGVTGYVDLQGAAVRVARDYLDGWRPVIARYATLGIA